MKKIHRQKLYRYMQSSNCYPIGGDDVDAWKHITRETVACKYFMPITGRYAPIHKSNWRQIILACETGVSFANIEFDWNSNEIGELTSNFTPTQ